MKTLLNLSLATISIVMTCAISSAGDLQDNKLRPGEAADQRRMRPADPRYWQVQGNAGTLAGQNFLGTTDNQPLELRVNNARVLRINPTEDPSMVNIIAGSSGNWMSVNVRGATIAGGGTLNFFGSTGTNSIEGSFGAIGGGKGNTIGRDAFAAAIGGGSGHTVGSGASYSYICGGLSNLIRPDAHYCTIGGGTENSVQLGFIMEGGFFTAPWYATIAGGWSNTLMGASATTIAGGIRNTIQVGSDFANIGGGSENLIADYNRHGTISGGWSNAIGSQSGSSVIGGGKQNTIEGSNPVHPKEAYCTIGGGWLNRIEGYGDTVGGGRENTITYLTDLATISGGYMNSIDFGSDFATIGGGSQNRIENANHATIPGGVFNVVSASFGFAAGANAHATHVGTFVWADSSFDGGPFSSTAPLQFSVRARGGVRFVTAVNAAGAPTAGVSLAPGSGTWASLSDRNAKENFAATDGREILEKVAALPLASWNYKSQDRSVRHLGPTAQDFHAAFGLGESDRTITTVDADGVALAAIQGLNQKLEEQAASLRAREAEIQDLKRAVAELGGRLSPKDTRAGK